MMALHSDIPHQNKLLRWLFLAVLAVGMLHFQEISDCCLNRIELVGSHRAQISNSGIVSIYHNRLRPASPTPSSLYSKNQQADFLNIHSQRLSIIVAQRPDTFFISTVVTAILSCQHFCSRSLSPEDPTDFHS
jgi:hypothetical protein